MNGQLHTFHVVLDIDHNSIVLAYLNTRPGDHTVDGQDTSLDTIGQHALTVTPYGVGGIRGTHLTGTVSKRKGNFVTIVRTSPEI